MSLHLKMNRKQLDSRLNLLKPLLKSNMNIFNRVPLYKTLLRSYGIALWRSAKPSNIKTVQAFRTVRFRTFTAVPRYVIVVSQHHDLKAPTINQIVAAHYFHCHSKMEYHPDIRHSVTLEKICRATLLDVSNANG